VSSSYSASSLFFFFAFFKLNLLLLPTFNGISLGRIVYFFFLNSFGASGVCAGIPLFIGSVIVFLQFWHLPETKVFGRFPLQIGHFNNSSFGV